MTGATHTFTSLHDHYVGAVNMAVAADDLDRAEQLARDFDVELLDAMRAEIAAAAA